MAVAAGIGLFESRDVLKLFLELTGQPPEETSADFVFGRCRKPELRVEGKVQPCKRGNSTRWN